MGLLDDIFSGRTSDIYGAGLLTPEQRGGIGNRGLLALAAQLGKSAGPSFSPVPDFGAALGMAAGAYGAGSDKAAETVFEGGYKGAQAKQLLSQIEYAKQLAPLLGPLAEAIARLNAGGGGAMPGGPQGTANLPSIQGPLAVPTGGAPRGLGGLLLPEIKSTDLGGDDSGTSRFPDLGIEYPATDPSGLKAGGALRRTQTAAMPTVSADLAPYQTGGLLAPQPAELPQLANYAVGNAVPGGASPITGVAPAMSNRLEAMLAGMPPDVLQKFNVLSGYRSPERNAQVYAEKGLPPSQNSRHTMGAAVDTTNDPAVLDWVRQNGPQYGVGYTLANLPGEQNHLEMLGAGGGRPDTVVPAGVGLPVQTAGLLSGSAREIADNNFGGMRRPGVNAGPSQGGFQAFATPAEGLAAISNQLDRYASGATTGKPLTTIRQIVSTWAPPNENPTETLIARASRIVGVDPDAPLDVSNPAVKAKLIEATIRNEQGGRLPVDPGLIEQAANASPGTVTGGPDTVVATGDRPSLPVQRTQYAPAQGGLLAPGVLPGTAPAAALPQVNPAYGDVLAQIARLRAQSELAGMKNDPFAAFTSALKDSPAYQQQLEIARKQAGLPFIGPETTARKAAEEPFDIRASERALGNALTEKGWRLGPDGKAVMIPEYDKVQQAISFAQAQGKAQGELPTTLIINDIQNQNDTLKGLRLQGIDGRFDKDGRLTTFPLVGAAPTAAAQAGAVSGAQARAKADVEAGTAPGLAGRTEFAKGIATQDLEHRKAAESARDSLEGLDDARAMVNSGIFAGAGADWKLRLAKAGQVLGFDNDRIANTESYIQLRAREVLNILGSRALGAGTGISSSDRDFATGVANGSIQLDERTIKRMLDIQEKVSTNAYNRWNRRADELEKAAPGTGARIEPPIRAGALPEGVPPGSVPGTPTIHGKPTWRTPNGKILVVE